MTTWGNDEGELVFRRRMKAAGESDAGAWPRLWIALGGLLLLALAYPVYEYEVQASLAKRDLLQATRQLQAEVQRSEATMANEINRRQTQARQLTYEQRLAAVRVMGISDAGGVPTVMVELQGLTAAQAAARICLQARGWLRRPLDGEVLRIRAARGERPAAEAGSIRCT